MKGKCGASCRGAEEYQNCVLTSLWSHSGAARLERKYRDHRRQNTALKDGENPPKIRPQNQHPLTQSYCSMAPGILTTSSLPQVKKKDS